MCRKEHLHVLLFFAGFMLLNAENNKRILLQDPDYFNAQMHALESRVQDLMTKYNELQTQMSNEIQSLLLKINQTANHGSAGGVFVRWGRKDCPISTETVYSGYAGGSWWDDPGAAAEFVCLPPDPDLVSMSYPSYFAKMYGAEYDTTYYANQNGDDVPCAVCRSHRETSVLMIPGKRSCYDGWTMQYHGNLVAGSPTYPSATQYICLDENSQALPSGSRNDNGKLFYPVFAMCGALACPPYHIGKYLKCAVCTK